MSQIETFVKSHFDDKYFISNLGNVRRESTGKIYNNRIYRGKERLFLKEINKEIAIAREVLSAFVSKPYENEIVKFKDGNSINSKLENIEWIEKGQDTIGLPYNPSRMDYSKPCGSVKQLFWGDEIILISEDGFIKTNCKSWKKPTVSDHTKNGYVTIWLPFDKNGNKKDGGIGCNHYIHTIIAEAFCKKEEGQTIARHIDKNKENNISSNLEWVTKEESNNDRDNSNTQNMKMVYKYQIGGEYTGQNFESATFAAKVMNLKSSTSISNCCNAKRGNSVGFEWSFFSPEEYKEERPIIMALVEEVKNSEKEERDKKKGPKKNTGKRIYGHVISDSVRTGEVIEWNSGKDASEETKIGTGNLSRYAKNNKRKEIELDIIDGESVKKRKVTVEFSKEG